MSSRSPLQPRPPQPIFAAYSSAPRPSSGPVAGTEPAHAMTVSSNPPKRKRGRPRKYAPDGTMPPTIIPTPYPTGAAASPTPVALPSSSALGLRVGVGSPRAPPAMPSPLPPPPLEHGSHPVKKPRQMAVAGPGATGLIPQVITIQGGEGCFHILSLSGLYVPSKTNGMSTRKGGLGISLAGPDGRVFGGGSAGPLIAASPVQVVIGMFLADKKKEDE
ncbi:hypothetical protein ZWY2020_050404 [Hordeum vulgare]|nr:hypothetical protein ZWY2020_050404 [Hordeum vulgare]